MLFQDADGATVLNYTGLKVWDADGQELDGALRGAGQNRVRLLVDERGARYPITIDPIAQQAYLKASNTDAGDSFGCSVAVSGDTVVVGAYGRGQQRHRGERRPERQQRPCFRRGLRVRAQRDDLEPAGLSQGLQHRGG